MRSRGRLRHASTASKAFSLRLETVDADTLEPQRASLTSSILRVETPARHISIIASSTEVSRLR